MTRLLVVGVSHQFATLSVRERLAFSRERIPHLLRALTGQPDEAAADSSPLSEAVLLSTCNRTEVYAAAKDLAAAESWIRGCLARSTGLSPAALADLLYVYTDQQAVEHLLRVAAGLESLILGENEILGQVRQAGEIAQEAGSSGHILSTLFRLAVQAGKRVRSETEIGRAGRSVATVVVQLAERYLGCLSKHTALIVGAGKISSLTARALVQAGLTCILVANRTYDRAVSVARSLGSRAQARAVHFDALNEVLTAADIVICSTGAPHTVLHTDAVRKAMAARPQRPLLIADLAVPRDADPEIGNLPGVCLVDIDGLEDTACAEIPFTQEARQAAEDIVHEEASAFNEWLISRRAVPLIQELREQADAICCQQVEQTLRRMGDLTPRQERLVKAMGAAIVGKMLHAPIQGLKHPPAQVPWEEYAEMVRQLFDLSNAGDEAH